MRTGKAIVVAGVALVAVLGVAAVWLSVRNRPKPDAVHQIVALGPTTALVRRGVVGAPRRQFLEYYELERGSVWRAIIRPPIEAGVGLSPMVIDVGAVSLRSVSDDLGQIVVYKLDDGKKMGTQYQLQGASIPAPDDAIIAVGDGISYDFYRQGGQLVVIATDLYAGHERWRATLDADNAGPVWVGENRLLVVHAGRVTSIDTADGRVIATMSSDDRPCITDREVVTSAGGRLLVMDLDGADSRPLDVETSSLTGLCGRFGDTIVLVMDREVLALGAKTYEVRWRVALGTYSALHAAGDEYRRRAPRASPMSGELPRYVPVQVGDGADASMQAIAMIDVQAGKLAWMSQPSPRLVGNLVRVDDLYYFLGADPVVIAELDGASGALTVAAQLDADGPLAWSQLGRGFLWVSRGVELDVIGLATPHRWAMDIRSQLAAALGI